MKKRILSFLTLLCIAVALLPANMITVSAYTGTNYSDYLYYQVESNGEVTITDCDESATEVEIPSEIDGKKVTSIGFSAFEDCRSLTSVTIGDSVTSIGQHAFYNCNSIESVYITNLSTYLNIDYYDVYAIPMRVAKKLYINGKRAQNITIPDSVARIPDYAFHNIDSIEKVTIEGNTLVEIGQCAFYSCINLTKINIPCSVKKFKLAHLLIATS